MGPKAKKNMAEPAVLHQSQEISKRKRGKMKAATREEGSVHAGTVKFTLPDFWEVNRDVL